MVTKERLRELFDYDSNTGDLVRRVGVKGSLKGTIIGTTKPNGYKIAVVDGKMYRLHHLVWMYHHGSAVEQLDHINRNPGDNRITNLRPCDCFTNSGNQTKRKGLYKGVSFCKATGKWKAQIQFGGKNFNLGRHVSIHDAAVTYNNMAKIVWGEFALLNEIVNEDS